MKILLIDNYDSFTYNLEHRIFEASGFAPEIITCDEMDRADMLSYEHIFISPGPGKPSDYPQYEILKNIKVPVTGMCLGMQILNELYGGKTGTSPRLMHGKPCEVRFMGERVIVGRYHSLYCAEVSDSFTVKGEYKDVPMFMVHNEFPYTGYQFHPESFLTDSGAWYIRYVLNRAYIHRYCGCAHG